MSKYFWPASAITEDDMAILYEARESSEKRIPITRLIAKAIRKTYGSSVPSSSESQVNAS